MLRARALLPLLYLAVLLDLAAVTATRMDEHAVPHDRSAAQAGACDNSTFPADASGLQLMGLKKFTRSCLIARTSWEAWHCARTRMRAHAPAALARCTSPLHSLQLTRRAEFARASGVSASYACTMTSHTSHVSLLLLRHALVVHLQCCHARGMPAGVLRLEEEVHDVPVQGRRAC